MVEYLDWKDDSGLESGALLVSERWSQFRIPIKIKYALYLGERFTCLLPLR